MSSAIPWDTVVVGLELGPVETEITEKAAKNYCLDWDDPNPWYLEASPWGRPVAPPLFMAGLACFRLLSTKFKTAATVGVKSEHETLEPIFVGQTLVTRGRIAEKYVKRGLEYVVVESESFDEAGRQVRRGVDHILLSLERVDHADV